MADMYGLEGDEGELTNQQKAAVLFIALGPEYSAKLFKHMDDDAASANTTVLIFIVFLCFNSKL